MNRIISSPVTRTLVGFMITFFYATHPGVWAQSVPHHLSEPEIEDLEAYEQARLAEFYQRIDQIKREADDYKESQLAAIPKPGPSPKSKGVGPGSGVPTALGTGMLYGGALGAAGGAAGGNAGLGSVIGAGVVGLIMAGMAASAEAERADREKKAYQAEVNAYKRACKEAEQRADNYRKELLSRYKAELAMKASEQRTRLNNNS
jgi:hypothetical protein